MGAMDERGNNGRKAAAQRGKSKSKRGGDGGKAFTLDGVGMVALMALMYAAWSEGAAVRAGLTRDGGAFAVGMYVDDEYGTEYIKPSEDARDALREIAAAWLTSGATAYPQIEAMLMGGKIPDMDALKNGLIKALPSA